MGPGDRGTWASHMGAGDCKGQGLFAVFCEPCEHHILVSLHPLDVGFGLLQGLLQSPGARAKAGVHVGLLELLQLPGKRGFLAPGWVSNTALRRGLPGPVFPPPPSGTSVYSPGWEGPVLSSPYLGQGAKMTARVKSGSQMYLAFIV